MNNARKAGNKNKKALFNKKPPRQAFPVKDLPEVTTCQTRAEIEAQSRQVHQAIADLIQEIPDEYLRVKADPFGWTIEKNIRHICRSTFYFSFWLGAPTWFVKLVGKAANPGVTIEEASTTNRPPNFDFGTYPEPGKVKAGLKEELIAEVLKAEGRLLKALNKRSDEELLTLKGAFPGMNMFVFAQWLIKHSRYHSGVFRGRIIDSGVLN